MYLINITSKCFLRESLSFDVVCHKEKRSWKIRPQFTGTYVFPWRPPSCCDYFIHSISKLKFWTPKTVLSHCRRILAFFLPKCRKGWNISLHTCKLKEHNRTNQNSQFNYIRLNWTIVSTNHNKAHFLTSSDFCFLNVLQFFDFTISQFSNFSDFSTMHSIFCFWFYSLTSVPSIWSLFIWRFKRSLCFILYE